MCLMFQAALSGAMERYFEAAAQGLVPWSEALWPETGRIAAEWRWGTRNSGGRRRE